MRIDKLSKDQLNDFVNRLEPKISVLGGRKFVFVDDKGRKHSFSLNKILAGMKSSPDKDLTRKLSRLSLDANEILKTKSFLAKTAHKIRHHLGRITNSARSERTALDEAAKEKLPQEDSPEKPPADPKSSDHATGRSSSSRVSIDPPMAKQSDENESDQSTHASLASEPTDQPTLPTGSSEPHDVKNSDPEVKMDKEEAKTSLENFYTFINSSKDDKAIVDAFQAQVKISKCNGFLAYIALANNNKFHLAHANKLMEFPSGVHLGPLWSEFVHQHAFFSAFHVKVDLMNKVLLIAILSEDKDLIEALLAQGVKPDDLPSLTSDLLIKQAEGRRYEILNICSSLPQSEVFRDNLNNFVNEVMQQAIVNGDKNVVEEAIKLGGSLTYSVRLDIMQSKNSSVIIDSLLLFPNDTLNYYFIKNFIQKALTEKTVFSEEQINALKEHFPEVYEYFKNQHHAELKLAEMANNNKLADKNLTAKILAHLSIDELLKREDPLAHSNAVWYEVAKQIGFTNEEIRGTAKSIDDVNIKQFILDYYEEASKNISVRPSRTKEGLSKYKKMIDDYEISLSARGKISTTEGNH